MANPEIVIRPDVRAFLDQIAARPRPEFTAEVLAAIRQMPPDAMASADLPVGDLAVMRDGVADGIPLRLFDCRASRPAGPVVVFFHGGGFVLGSIATHAALAAEISRGLDLPVISVDYRLAPEHPWPAGVDDAEAATRWIAANGAAFDRDFTGLILCGDSAGGNFAIVTALALRDRPATLPVIFQFVLYPGVDHVGDHYSKTAFADGLGMESANMRLYFEHYRPDPPHWRSSPLFAELAGLPPMLLVTAALDPLRDEGRAFAGAAIAAGVATTYREIAGTIHGFATYRRGIPSAQADLDAILTLARALIAETAMG